MGEMSEISNEPLLFRELPKEQRKALQKEYSQNEESKKQDKALVFCAIIYAVVIIVLAIISFTAHNDTYYFSAPTFFIILFPAVARQSSFEKWLSAEKNIVTKRKK